MSGGEKDQNWIHVDWNPPWLLSLMESDRRQSIATEITQHGLERITSRDVARDGSVYRSEAYHAQVSDGEVGVTRIACSPPSPANPRSCQHHFLHNSWLFYFRHRPEDLPDWKVLQKRVIDLFASFAV
jgi:hypothetical protein